MAIINLTPDSFYASSRIHDYNLLKTAEATIKAGADILDLGAYSSRPGAEEISVEIELKRLIEPLKMLVNEFPEIPISVDTFRGRVAEEAIQAGAEIINDISAFSMDAEMLPVLKKYKPGYVLMHMKGTPKNMQTQTQYDNLIAEICEFFIEKLSILEQIGLTDICIDPGFGFSKSIDQNYKLLDQLEQFKTLKRPILVGVSRKSMIYKRLNCRPEDALNGSIALNAIALSKGAQIIRVHDVAEHRELIDLLFKP